MKKRKKSGRKRLSDEQRDRKRLEQED